MFLLYFSSSLDRCYSWMQAAKQKSSSCNLTNWKDTWPQKPTKAVFCLKWAHIAKYYYINKGATTHFFYLFLCMLHTSLVPELLNSQCIEGKLYCNFIADLLFLDCHDAVILVFIDCSCFSFHPLLTDFIFVCCIELCIVFVILHCLVLKFCLHISDSEIHHSL